MEDTTHIHKIVPYGSALRADIAKDVVAAMYAQDILEYPNPDSIGAQIVFMDRSKVGVAQADALIAELTKPPDGDK